MSERTGSDESYDGSFKSVDLSAAHADDALLDAISGSDPMIADELGEAELNALLVSWRRDVDSEPLPELVDADTAISTIRAATLARRHSARERRRRMLVPVAAAAAVLAIAFTGTGLVARDAQPGDALWGLTKVLYADKARSVEAATELRADFRLVRNAIQNGDLGTARNMLDKAESKLKSVDAEENRDGLEAEHQNLEEQLDGQDDPADTPNPAPDSSSSTTTTPDEPSSSPSESTSPSESSTPPPSSSTDPDPSSPPSSSSSSDGTPDGIPGISGKTSSDTADGEATGAEAGSAESTGGG